VQGYPQGEKEVTDGLGYVLARITADLKRVHREGLSSLKSQDDQATQVPTNFQANVQVCHSICTPEAQAIFTVILLSLLLLFV